MCIRDRRPGDRRRLDEAPAQPCRERREAEDDEQAILDSLRPLAVETRVNDIFGERMIVNAAFLVNRCSEPELDTAIQGLDQQMKDRMLFRYVGPVPPYNFVNLVIRWNH